MTTTQILARAITYGLVLSAADAVGGRLLRAAPDPSMVIPLLATGWIAYRLGRYGPSRLAVPAAVTLFAAYLLVFPIWAALLVGWNGAVPWRPKNTTWLVAGVLLAPVVAFWGRRAGMSAVRDIASPPTTPQNEPR